MPTVTFYHLTPEKKEKIIQAAKKEFSRVSVNEASIKNIVEDAGIARGSFYQYFESKEDLFDYLFEDMGKFKTFVHNELEKEKIDIFDFNLSIYTYLLENLRKKENIDFGKEMFKNLKVSDIDFFKFSKEKEELPKPMRTLEFLSKVDTSSLKFSDIEDIKRLNQVLFFITRGMLATNFHYPTKEEAKEHYQKTLEIIKYGVCK